MNLNILSVKHNKSLVLTQTTRRFVCAAQFQRSMSAIGRGCVKTLNIGKNMNTITIHFWRSLLTRLLTKPNICDEKNI